MPMRLQHAALALMLTLFLFCNMLNYLMSEINLKYFDTDDVLIGCHFHQFVPSKYIIYVVFDCDIQYHCITSIMWLKRTFTLVRIIYPMEKGCLMKTPIGHNRQPCQLMIFEIVYFLKKKMK